jgi:hypothetical protein
MATEPEQPIPPQTPAEGVPVLYINWFRTVGSPGDLAVDVGYQTNNMPPQPAAHLVMTWEHAKLLRDTLSEVIENIEKVIGEPRDLREHMALVPPRFGSAAASQEQDQSTS